MRALTSIVVMLFGISVGIGSSVLVMIKGWGLEPKSWFWIIFMYLFLQIFAQLLIKLGETNLK